MSDKGIDTETTLTPEEKTSQLNSIFKRVLRNNDLAEQAKLTKRNIEITPSLFLTPNHELQMVQENKIDLYKLDQETGKITNNNGQEFSGKYESLFPGTNLKTIEETMKKVDNLTYPTQKLDAA
ncbi:MAG TPA: hypothetical protein VG895_01080 [Patescibacteria group bacterium]|nr:hypothetical protein [Patescibacteria group bacterium]